jgi:AcrR family transcriptional regulator
MPSQKTDAINTPQQERSRETLRKLLEATETLLAKEPAKELSVRQVLKLSGVSNGSFYAMFPNKEALIKECWKSLVETVDDNINKNFEDLMGLSLAEKVHRLLEMQVKRYFKYRGVFRAYLNLMRTTNLKPTSRNMSQYAQYGKRTRELLLASKDEIKHPEPLHAISIAEFVTFAAARELIFHPHTPHASSMKLTQKKMVDELTNVYLAMLNYVPQ